MNSKPKSRRPHPTLPIPLRLLLHGGCCPSPAHSPWLLLRPIPPTTPPILTLAGGRRGRRGPSSDGLLPAVDSHTARALRSALPAFTAARSQARACTGRALRGARLTGGCSRLAGASTRPRPFHVLRPARREQQGRARRNVVCCIARVLVWRPQIPNAWVHF